MRIRKDFVSLKLFNRSAWPCPYCGSNDVNYVPGTSRKTRPTHVRRCFACEMCGGVHWSLFDGWDDRVVKVTKVQETCL